VLSFWHCRPVRPLGAALDKAFVNGDAACEPSFSRVTLHLWNFSDSQGFIRSLPIGLTLANERLG